MSIAFWTLADFARVIDLQKSWAIQALISPEWRPRVAPHQKKF